MKWWRRRRQLQRQRWELVESLDRQARVDIRIGDRGELIVITHNRQGVIAARALSMWFGLDPPAIATGDSITFEKEVSPEREEVADDPAGVLQED